VETETNKEKNLVDKNSDIQLPTGLYCRLKFTIFCFVKPEISAEVSSIDALFEMNDDFWTVTFDEDQIHNSSRSMFQIKVK